MMFNTAKSSGQLDCSQLDYSHSKLDLQHPTDASDGRGSAKDTVELGKEKHAGKKQERSTQSVVISQPTRCAAAAVAVCGTRNVLGNAKRALHYKFTYGQHK